ncbi:MAG: YraN family protein [Actinomycetota bacterium]
MAGNQRMGRRGEDAAAAWYRRRGYRIVARNWRVRAGEIDLICARGDLVAFVEVKTRFSDRYGRGVEAVGWRKRQRLRGLAVHWLQTTGGGYDDVRFDVVEVDGAGRVEVYEGCF